MITEGYDLHDYASRVSWDVCGSEMSCMEKHFTAVMQTLPGKRTL